MIRRKQHKGFLYFDGFNKFVLCYGIKYFEDNHKQCDLIGIQESTIKNLSLDFSQLDLSLGYSIATNINLNTELFKYFKKEIPLKEEYSTDNLELLYCDFIGSILSQKLGLGIKTANHIEELIKLAKTDEKINYHPVLVACSYFSRYAQFTTYFDR